MKKYLFFTICVFMAMTAFSMEFTIAPFYFIDETKDQAFPRNNYHEKLLFELGKTFLEKGFVFDTINNRRHNPPQSVSDAIILCRSEEVDYLIYGYITKKDRTIHGELRLLDYEKREVIANFYSMDDNDREDELIQDLARKLYRFIQETYKIEIIPEIPSYAHFQFPISLGYWLPINSEWGGILYGIFRIDGGVQFIPNDRIYVVMGKIYYFSVGIDISYRLGRAKYYDAWTHGIIINTPMLFYRVINKEHKIFTGLGLYYSWDLLQIKKPYEDPTVDLFTTLGFTLNLGWEYSFDENIFFFADLRFNMSFYESNFVCLSPRVGITIRKHSKEVYSKW